VKMLQFIHALAFEINTGIPIKRGASILNHAKQIGWLPETVRQKKVALGRFVYEAEKGFGYVRKGSIVKAIHKPRKGSKKALAAQAAAEKVPA
jgi:hypothetical protein